jgi:hypothetical protein
MSVILIDRIGSVVFHNGILRFDCMAAGPNGEERAAGTLLIPANQAGRGPAVPHRSHQGARPAPARAGEAGSRREPGIHAGLSRRRRTAVGQRSIARQ